MTARSIWAVVAGALFVIVVTTLVDLALHAAGMYPAPGESMTDGQALLASSYRLVFGIAGGWLTARLAPRRPMLHAIILGSVGALVALVGVVVTWNENLGPHWYPVSLVVLALPQTWAGAKLFESRSRSPLPSTA